MPVKSFSLLKNKFQNTPRVIVLQHNCIFYANKLCVCAGTDSETALRDAFVMFDEEKKGKLAEE